MQDLSALCLRLGLSLPPSNTDTEGGPPHAVRSPIDGRLLAHLRLHQREDLDRRVGQAAEAFAGWAQTPAPQRGELIRLLGETLRTHKDDLAQLVSLEAGKIPSEARGEVQEMIDICDFAVGLSRQLYGLTIASERPEHRMMEQWLPLGVVGVITAFNFPVAVWAWNAALALVCGNTIVWKPSEKTPLTALATEALFRQACAQHPQARTLPGLLSVVIGRADIGRCLAEDRRVRLVSATGSCRMGQDLAPRVAARLGRSLLELGGNNAVIVAPTADLSLALRGVVFGAWGTAGQRCTTTRRLIVHRSIHDAFVRSIEQARRSLRIGNPLDHGTLVGPLIDQAAFNAMQHSLTQAQTEGGIVYGGSRVLADHYPDAWYAEPALVVMPSQTAVVCEETFAPILYVMAYDDFASAIAMNNSVEQGLSSALFTRDLQEAEQFLSVIGSDCGIANVNLGTSGAEIGGAFGGEKKTGGGRESGSDAWKSYMRRTTNTINYGKDLPLAQGVSFDL